MKMVWGKEPHKDCKKSQIQKQETNMRSKAKGEKIEKKSKNLNKQGAVNSTSCSMSSSDAIPISARPPEYEPDLQILELVGL